MIPALCSAINESGHDVEICTFRQFGHETIPAREVGVPIRYFEPLPATVEFPTISFYRELRKLVASFDVVHLHYVWNPAISLAAHVCRSVNKSYVLSPHGMLRPAALQRHRLKKSLYRQVVDRKTISAARAVVVFSPLEAAETEESKLAERIQIIPNGIDPALAMQVQSGRFIENFPALKDKMVVLFLGRLHWSKNLPLQFEAMRSVLKQKPETVWVLIGPDEGEWNALRKSIRDHGLEDRVLWLGLLDRTRCLQALKDCHVALLTSRHEGHSMAMNEALAVGVPVVLTHSVGFAPLEPAGAGFVVPSAPADIAEAVLRILNEPKLAESMRRAGQALVRKSYSWSSVARQHVRMYRHILEA
jgi:glycosyltransferase involved in cell wall biosynthesis